MGGFPLAEITIVNHGLFADHNMPCAVCGERPAVYHCQRLYFDPCWACQEVGWILRKPRPWRRRKREAA